MVSSKLTIGCYFRKQMLAGGELPFTWKCYNLKVKGYKGGNCTIPAYVEAKKHLNLPRKSHRVTCQSLSPKIPNIDFPIKMADSRVVSQVIHMLAIHNSKDTTQVQPLRWPACNSQGHRHPKTLKIYHRQVILNRRIYRSSFPENKNKNDQMILNHGSLVM